MLAPARLPELPDVPSAAEVGPPVETSIWAVMAAPKGLQPDVRSSLQQACRATLDDPAYRTIALRAGFPPFFRGGEEFREFVGGEFKRFGEQMKAEGLELE